MIDLSACSPTLPICRDSVLLNSTGPITGSMLNQHWLNHSVISPPHLRDSCVNHTNNHIFIGFPRSDQSLVSNHWWIPLLITASSLVFPGRANHWSAIIGGSHSKNYVLWEYGGYASEGVKQVAELGSPVKMEEEIRQQVGKKKLHKDQKPEMQKPVIPYLLSKQFEICMQ